MTTAVHPNMVLVTVPVTVTVILVSEEDPVSDFLVNEVVEAGQVIHFVATGGQDQVTATANGGSEPMGMYFFAIA